MFSLHGELESTAQDILTSIGTSGDAWHKLGFFVWYRPELVQGKMKRLDAALKVNQFSDAENAADEILQILNH